MPLWVIVWYLGVGVLWILCSDWLLGSLIHDTELLTRIQTVKGWLFLLATSCLLHLLIRRGLAVIA
jgi:hypothetical protein